MDLYAYTQIEDLEEILKKQNIDVPRLRGLRLMKEEKPISKERIEEIINGEALDIVERIVEQGCLYRWRSDKRDTRNDILIRKEVDYDGRTKREVVGCRWNKIHGKKRKQIKFEIKKMKKRVYKAFELWNKYVGEDVLYVHSRCGWLNWNYCRAFELEKHPDFLDKCDDYWDYSYCDIYFKIHN